MLIRLPQYTTTCSVEAWAAENQATILAPSARSTADSTTMTPASTTWSRRGGPTGFVPPRAGAAAPGGLTPRRVWVCRPCRHHTSATAGTVLHRTRLPLTTWFAAAYLVASLKPGVSALPLHAPPG